MPKTSILGQIVFEILAQLCSDDSVQILLNLTWVITFRPKSNLCSFYLYNVGTFLYSRQLSWSQRYQRSYYPYFYNRDTSVIRKVSAVPLVPLIKSFNVVSNATLLYRHECFTGKYTTRKIHKNYIRDPSGLFSIISLVSLSMT